MEYRFLSNENITKKVWDEAQIKLASEENDEKSSSFCMDVIWGYLASLKLGNGSHKFGTIIDIAKTVLVLQTLVKKELFGLLSRLMVY